MNWENLKETKCPKCSNKLKCRVAGNVFRIKSQHLNAKSKKENWYFCSYCDGFQISSTKLAKVVKKLSVKLKEIPKQDKHLFKSGLLSL